MTIPPDSSPTRAIVRLVVPFDDVMRLAFQWLVASILLSVGLAAIVGALWLVVAILTNLSK